MRETVKGSVKILQIIQLTRFFEILMPMFICFGFDPSLGPLILIKHYKLWPPNQTKITLNGIPMENRIYESRITFLSSRERAENQFKLVAVKVKFLSQNITQNWKYSFMKSCTTFLKI